MFEGNKPPPKRKSQDKPPMPPELERKELLEEIHKMENVSCFLLRVST